MTIGTTIKSIREERSMSRKQLSELTGLSSTAIFYIETDKRIPTMTTGKKIARALKCTLDELVPDDEPTIKAS